MKSKTNHLPEPCKIMTTKEFYPGWHSKPENKHLSSMEFATDYANYVSEIKEKQAFEEGRKQELIMPGSGECYYVWKNVNFKVWKESTK